MSDIAAYMNQATKTARVIDGLPNGLALRPVERVGIIGAGTMGGGIAMNFASAGIEVVILETTSMPALALRWLFSKPNKTRWSAGLASCRPIINAPPIAVVFRSRK